MDAKKWVSTLTGVLRPILRNSTLTRSESGEHILLDAPDGQVFIIEIRKVG